MLYQTFNSLKESLGQDYFVSRVSEKIIKNLNPKFELREYQKEALGRFDFYFNGYQKKQNPTQLLFHMATGSGKTLIMAANILYLYRLGYRYFIFFVNSKNIIEKTRENFLNPLSEKYLFNQKINIDGKEVFIKEVENFEAANPQNINIVFTTIQGLHENLNSPKENTITFEDFEDKEIVLISDEAHHLQVATTGKKEKEIENNWENTVKKIFESNYKNVLLEFTATIDLTDENIRKKYEDKIIFQYDLKQFRIDKYSKEIEVLQVESDLKERMLYPVILSQYRRKIAEKYKLYLKPVILFKSKTIKESEEHFKLFLETIKNLKEEDLLKIFNNSKKTIFEKIFSYLQSNNISIDNFVKEIKNDFSQEKLKILNSENIDEKDQLTLNTLEEKTNELRAIFAVDMLNEGWDVLNLFDIVRLYDTRDGRWDKRQNKYIPGKTTMSEAQLIGRGARYWPFKIEENQDEYKRKFDDDFENEIRILETLFYHSRYNPRYIDEIKATLTEIGLLPEKYTLFNFEIKKNVKKEWQDGFVFVNQKEEKKSEASSLADLKIKLFFEYSLKNGLVKENILLDENFQNSSSFTEKQDSKKIKLLDLGENIVRFVIDKEDFFHFSNLKKYFPNLKSIKEFIRSSYYLGSIEILISGDEKLINNLDIDSKLEIASFVLKSIASESINKAIKYVGSPYFQPKKLWGVFHDKKIKIDKDEEDKKEFNDFSLADTDWFAHNGFYGSSEEKGFLKFINSLITELKKKYFKVLILRNEKYFQIYNFDDGQAYEPDFILLLKKRNHKIITYQVFIEPKADIYIKNEPWKGDLLANLEKKAIIEKDLLIKMESDEYRILGLPFYNENLRKEFEKKFKEKLL